MENISIVVPVWNEGKNIAPLIERISRALSSKKIKFEIIFIDDRSTDDTQVVISSFLKGNPVELYVKQGKKGKAFSLIEGFQKAKYDVLVMMDADLQYPPEAIPLMLEKIKNGADVVVADRKKANVSRLRQFLSNGFKKVFGKILFGIPHDVQSGLKVFRKEVLQTTSFSPKTGWTFDLEFLHRASNAGFVIESHPIIFEARKSGKSKVSALQVSIEIGYSALALKTKRLLPQTIPPKETGSMQGAGIGYKRKKYITHTTLHHSQSAIRTFLFKQKLLWAALIAAVVFGLFANPLLTLQIIIGVLSFIYFLDVIFNLYLILKSLHVPQEITFTEDEISSVNEKDLPVYSILCPLYKEAHIIPHFLHSIDKLDYPKNKLDVLLLLEEDDTESIEQVSKMKLPSYVRSVVVPHSQPKTKPKACNYGLSMAKGEYLVIFDAEDMPDPLQLKKAYIAFQKSGKNIVCLQAKLNYYNPHQNLLTRFFTAEYSLWFDVTLTGLQSIGTSIPLGGTSNHFRTADLKTLEGWDPFNVTEDADLGIRLFKKGYKTAIIDSVTLEEANSKVGNWIRQRSRWIKGYMQTYLVHTRELFGFKKIKGIHGLFFHLTIGGKIAFILINPILWLATISYFALYAIVGPTIESLYPSYVFYMAATSLVAGNFLFLYYYMIGLAKRDQWNLVKFVFFVPFYWLLISWAGFVAFYQLLFKPHYWEKTIHGLHLNKKSKKIIAKIVVETEENTVNTPFPHRLKALILHLVASKKLYISGSLLIIVSVGSNFLNFLFNAYLGRVQDFDDFALVSLLSVLSYLASILFGALNSTVNYRAGFLNGKNGEVAATLFWQKVRRKSLYLTVVLIVVWLVSVPFLSEYFKTSSVMPFILFTPIWIAGIVGSVDKGFFLGRLLFGYYAAIIIVESILRVLFAYSLVHLNLTNSAYISIPLASFISFLVGWLMVSLKKPKNINLTKNTINTAFPKKFFLVSILSGLSIMTFLSLDIALAKHYLSPVQAGEYALISLVGKMIFFLSSFATQFIVPLISQKEGRNENSIKTFYAIFLATFVLTLVGYFSFGLLGFFTIPLLFGAKTLPIVKYLSTFAFAILGFSLARAIIGYYLTKKVYTFPMIGFLAAILQIFLITTYHQNIGQIVDDMLIVGVINLLSAIFLHIFVKQVIVFERNVYDFVSIFFNGYHQKETDNIRILIFNWRDTKHKWAGGAEVYIHEIAKQWVKDGSQVTIFCGNDGDYSRNEIVDGIQIIRRGGFYTVYFWAFLYYVLKFRGMFDVVIDSENGIPFFTPLYVRRPLFLLIHHVHQEVFRKSLKPPFSWLAEFLELKAMPIVYKNIQVITVSPSSKEEILKHKLTKQDPTIIYNGVNLHEYKPGKKSKTPLVLYVGRLQYYKSLNVFIKAAKKIIEQVPNAEFIIAGEGGEKEKLIKYTKKKGMENKIVFTGKVPNEEKIKLFQKAWVFVNPSFMEGWGITTIEANACGTPAVASDVPGLRDSIRNPHTGYLVSYGDYEEFANKVLYLIKNESIRNEFSKESIKWAQNFSWEVSANNFSKIILNFLKNKRFQISYVTEKATL